MVYVKTILNNACLHREKNRYYLETLYQRLFDVVGDKERANALLINIACKRGAVANCGYSSILMGKKGAVTALEEAKKMGVLPLQVDMDTIVVIEKRAETLMKKTVTKETPEALAETRAGLEELGKAPKNERDEIHSEVDAV